MKKSILAMLVLAISAPAFANDEVGGNRQALGETCGLVVNYVEGTDGGCGGDPAWGDIQIAGTVGVEGGKTYDVVFTGIDSADRTYEIGSPIRVSNSRDTILNLDTILWSPGAGGNFAIQMSVYNAVTGGEVCSEMKMVNVVR